MSNEEANYKRIRIKEVREEVKDFKTLVFEDGHGIRYLSGQYLTLVRYGNDTEVRRSYSITSSPSLNEPLAIGVKRTPNGFFSRQLVDQAKAGDELLTTGSGGLFILPTDVASYQQLFFFAAGSGITPVYSLIKTVLITQQHLSVVLVYSNASVEKAVFLTELQQLQQRFPGRLQLVTLFSNSADLSKARLHRDLILQLLNKFGITTIDKLLFYICGPESYMRLCTYTLQEKGIDPSNIKKENFIIHTLATTAVSPPDKEDHSVTITMAGKVYNIRVSHPDSILTAAKKQGVVLPYSCRSASCGNCVAQRIKGTIWHSANDVLTERELQQGLVLTCVGHPQWGDVELAL